MAFSSSKNPLVLCILDGWGWAPDSPVNAITRAQTPHWDELISCYPSTLLDASGTSVGLPKNQMGNSEVGHMTIGSGRTFLQDLPRINQALEANEVASKPVFQNFVKTLKGSKGTAHLMGLLSPGGVHSHQDHFFGIAKLLAEHEVPVALHLFLDGRDTSPRSAQGYIGPFLEKLNPLFKDPSHVRLASCGGRYFAMDRDNNWDRVRLAYRTIVRGENQTGSCWEELIQLHYNKGIEDEFIPPHAFTGYQGIKPGDGLFTLNFRADRVRQLLRALVTPDFSSFDRGERHTFTTTLGMTAYAEDLTPLVPPLFPPEKPESCLGSLLADSNLTQLRTAETEKYAHVTFFFNGGREEPFKGEERVLIPSPSVATYDLCPEMSAQKVTDTVVKSLEEKAHDVIIMNLANADMVGHTGDFQAAKKAVEAVDTCLGHLHQAILKAEGTLLVTADHGNVEQMSDASTGLPHTAHTTNFVPFVFVYSQLASPLRLNKSGTLADITPTILSVLGLAIPDSLSGQNLCSPQ